MPRKTPQISTSISDYHRHLIKAVGLDKVSTSEAVRTLIEFGADYMVEHGLAQQIPPFNPKPEIHHGGKRPGAGRRRPGQDK